VEGSPRGAVQQYFPANIQQQSPANMQQQFPANMQQQFPANMQQQSPANVRETDGGAPHQHAREGYGAAASPVHVHAYVHGNAAGGERDRGAPVVVR
jgi:hypothetical protein